MDFLVEEAHANVKALDYNSETPLAIAQNNNKNEKVIKYLQCIENLPSHHFDKGTVKLCGTLMKL